MSVEDSGFFKDLQVLFHGAVSALGLRPVGFLLVEPTDRKGLSPGEMFFDRHMFCKTGSVADVRPPARRAYSSERRKRLLSLGLFYQFFSEIFAARIQLNILYISMVQMDIPFFGSSLGLSGQDPVSGLVAGLPG